MARPSFSWGPLAGSVGAIINRPGDFVPARSHSHVGTPPILFLALPKKRMRRARWKRKNAWARSGAVALRADGGRRVGASADFGLPSGTLSSSAGSMLPSRGGWCGGQRGARTHLTNFSFRAFRSATRCPGSRGERPLYSFFGGIAGRFRINRSCAITGIRSLINLLL